jgi:diaminohydroxyphosphoribosylaminopyrimidine deaminase/5-amino-6-(5-phosphoribosylamino)uracil reductase
MVGAVLVRKAEIIAEAFHKGFGKAHAERGLLEAFEGPIESDDVLYVNLEPCCHTGKTPPCTDIIIERGMKHVVYGMQDPDHRVAGKGTERLRESGIEVVGPIERTLCENLNRGFSVVRKYNRPFITVKMAQDRAGRISNDNGSPLKITSDDQNAWSHTWLRAKHDAILVGVQTVINDNPLLNTRFMRNEDLSIQSGLDKNSKNLKNKNSIQYSPVRVVLDPQLRIPVDARVCHVTEQQTIIFVTDPSRTDQAEKVSQLESKGVQVEAVKTNKSGEFEWEALWQVFLSHGITSVLVEGGARTWELFRKHGFIDQQVVQTQQHPDAKKT